MLRPWAAGLLLSLALAGCGKPGAAGPPAASGLPSKVAYVRMDALMKVHPLYGELQGYERNIEALNFGVLASQVPKSGPELAQADAELQRELREAAARTNALLKEKQTEYIQRETAAINAALANAGIVHGPSGAQIQSGVQNVASQQSAQAVTQLRSDLVAYQQTLIKQDQAQVDAATRTINERAARTYRAKADELSAKEAAFSLQLASQDAGQRLAMRTKVANLALDDAQRDQVRQEMAALDRQEGDQVAAMRNRDAQTLSQLQAQLRAQSTKELDAQIAAIHAATSAKLRQRADVAGAQFGLQSQTAVAPGAPGRPPAVPPDLKPKLEALHKQFQDAFKKDAQATIASFNKTRADLQRRYAVLHGVDVSAQERAAKEIADLQKQHDALYNEMIAQIQDQVRVLAESRGYSVVFDNIIAPGATVDLTADAEKEIESLHE